MLDKTKEEYLGLLRKNERLRKELDTLKNKTSSDVADDGTPSEASIPEKNPPSLSRPPSPWQPVQTLEELVLYRDYARLYSDILQITLHPALCIDQKTLGPSSFEKASFYDPATWDSLSPAARNLRIRGGIFDLVARFLLLGSSCRADLVFDWSLHRASVEALASFQKLMIRDAGSKLPPSPAPLFLTPTLDPDNCENQLLTLPSSHPVSREKINAWHRMWLQDEHGTIFNSKSTGQVFVTDAIMDLLRPVLSPSRTEQDELSLSQAVTQLCERAYDVGRLMFEGGFNLTILEGGEDVFGLATLEVGEDVGTNKAIIAGFEGPALEVGDAGEVLFTLFAGMARGGRADGRIRWLKKPEVVVGPKKMASAADMEAVPV